MSDNEDSTSHGDDFTAEGDGTPREDENRDGDDNDEFSYLMDKNVGLEERMREVEELLRQEGTQLQQCTLEEYHGTQRLSSLAKHAGRLCEQYRHQVEEYLTRAGGIRQQTTSIRQTVQYKIDNEGVEAWMKGPPANPIGKNTKLIIIIYN